MVKRQKRCCTEQDKNYPPLLAAPFGLTTITQPLCLTVKGIGVLLATLSMGNFINQTSKFSYYQLRPISSTRKYLSTEATVKLPWSPGSFCHALTTAILSFPVCLLPLSIAFVQSDLCCSPRSEKQTKTNKSKNKNKNLTRSLLCFDFSTGSQYHKEFSTA